MQEKTKPEEEQDSFDLETEYEALKEKYTLPNFEQLLEDFDLEKIQDKETIFLAREIRRTISEKLSAYIHLLETLINPTSPPMFVFKILKNVSGQEKEKMKEFYDTLSKTQIKVMKLDTVYSETEEAKFINENFKMWQTMKLEMQKLFNSFEKNFEKSDEAKERSYFD